MQCASFLNRELSKYFGLIPALVVRANACFAAQLEKWEKGRPGEMRVEFIVNFIRTMEGGLAPSATAALAGDLERAIYGKLLDEPFVFVRYCYIGHFWRSQQGAATRDW